MDSTICPVSACGAVDDSSVGALNYVALTEQAASDVASWIRDDADGRRWLASYADHPSWWRLVLGDANRYGWIFVEDGYPHGFVDLEFVGEVAYAAIFVRPASRSRGLGRRVLREVGDVAAELGALRMEGGVDPMNAASRRMCRAAGFVESGVDDEGYIVMRKVARQTPS